MKVPVQLANAFGADFEAAITRFLLENEAITDPESLKSVRFLSRSIVPHILKLSSLFNRESTEQSASLEPYWKESSNPAHLRLAYFVYFMPANLFRVASVWAELSRLGFRWNQTGFRAVEFGAGPASGACGIAAAEAIAGVGLPKSGSWALIEQDRAMLEWGNQWASQYFSQLGIPDWGIRPFHRRLEFEKGFLPHAAPKFHLWLMSFYLNEVQFDAGKLAARLVQDWTRHLEDEGIVILIEPALKLQSRRLLELRKELLKIKEKGGADWLQILLPCLGHQTCGALENPQDWCHEEVSWWRPPYFKRLDQLTGLDRKTLPFSYLVIARSKRPREEILPGLKAKTIQDTYRLVSPAHMEGKEQEFFLCGQSGKRRARYRAKGKEDPAAELQRGDILVDAEVRGDVHSSRVQKFGKLA